MKDSQFDEFLESLKKSIEHKYSVGPYDLGWRFLYSPESTLKNAKVAFLGMNPGGDKNPENHAEFAMEAGSAYVLETWKEKPPGEEKLQMQVRKLFDMLGVEPSEVLTGNIVPFRSPSWSKLCDRKNASAFGLQLWDKVFKLTKPELTIAMGGEAIKSTCAILNVKDCERVPVGWGNICAKKGSYEGGTFVGLPHLSRFSIIGRSESEKALSYLFDAR